MRTIALLPLAIAVALLSGCATGPLEDPFTVAAPEDIILKETKLTAEQISKDLRGRLHELKDGKLVALPETVLVTSLVEASDVRHSSGFGRIFSEQIAGALAQKGIIVSEIKMGNTIQLVTNGSQGEFILSRDIQEISTQRQATTVIVGTYAPGQDFVLVSVKALDAKTGRILSARNFNVPFTARLFR